MLEALYTACKHTYHLSWIFGSFPLSYNIERGFTKNIFGIIFTSFWLIIAVAHTLFTPYYIHENSTLGNASQDVNSFDDFEKPSENDARQIASDPDLQSTVIRYINPMLILSMSISSRYISIILLPKLILNLQYSIEKIDFILSFLTPRNSRLIDYSRNIFFFFLLVSVPVNCLYLYFSLPTPPSYRWWGLVWSCLLVYNNLAAFSTEVQFSNYCFMVRSRYKIINNYFKKFIRSSLSRTTMDKIYKRSSTINDLSLETNKFGANYYNELFTINNIPRNRSPRIKQNKVSIEKNYRMKALRLILYGNCITSGEEIKIEYLEMAIQSHKWLSTVVDEINHTYQLQILSSLFSCFIKLLFNVYFSIFGNIIGQLHNPVLILSTTGKTVLWSIFYLLRFLCIVISGSLIAKEANSTKTIVASLANRLDNPIIKEELSNFLKYTSTEKNLFTAFGLFDLNTKLITSALGAGATYLVILVQFHASECK